LAFVECGLLDVTITSPKSAKAKAKQTLDEDDYGADGVGDDNDDDVDDGGDDDDVSGSSIRVDNSSSIHQRKKLHR